MDSLLNLSTEAEPRFIVIDGVQYNLKVALDARDVLTLNDLAEDLSAISEIGSMRSEEDSKRFEANLYKQLSLILDAPEEVIEKLDIFQQESVITVAMAEIKKRRDPTAVESSSALDSTDSTELDETG